MKKKIGPILAAVILIVIVAVIGVASKVVEKYTPSKEVMNLAEYYGVSGNEDMAIVIQDTLVEEKGILKDGVAYLNYQSVKNKLNKRFYWDAGANLMVYTTPTEIIYILAGEKSYSISDNITGTDYTIVRADGADVYIAADFVKQYTNMEYMVYDNPNRMVITNQWGSTNYADVKKEGSIRYQGGIKSPILRNAENGEKVTVLEPMETWTKVRTQDGYIGYIENKKLGETYEEVTNRDFEEPVYTNMCRDYKINLVWHQITSMESNLNLLSDIAEMKGVNVISPTWFSISSNEGDITSLASEDYVKTAHDQGLEVWGLVDNFSEEISTTEVLSSTISRETLSNQLIDQAIQYGLEGINIDFETIPEEAGEAYIQFLREISVKCRENNLVLSVDDPVPMPYTMHYDRKEQGIVTDYVIIMGYDEHYVGSEEAGTVASLEFERNGIEETLKEVPAEKIISGIPFYTRLWKTDSQGNVTSEAIGMNGADQWIKDNGLTLNWSEDTSQEYAEMTDAEGTRYQIWLENEKSLKEKAKLVNEYGLGGIAAWKLGFERPSIWKVLSKNVG